MRLVILSICIAVISGCRSRDASGGSPVAPDDDANCMSADLSLERAKPSKSAEPPYAECAAGVFSHCGDGNGERGSYCSRPLDVSATARVRKKKPGVCCY